MSEDAADYIYEQTTRSTLDLDLQGIWINDREPLFKARLVVPLISCLNEYSYGRLACCPLPDPRCRLRTQVQTRFRLQVRHSPLVLSDRG